MEPAICPCYRLLMLFRLLVFAAGAVLPLAADLLPNTAPEQIAATTEPERPVKVETPEFAAKLHAWEADAMRPIPWQPLSSAAVPVAQRSTLAVLEDESIRAPSEICTVRIKERLTGVTAFRLEAVLDEPCPNAVVTEFSVQIAPKENGHLASAPPPPSTKLQPGGARNVALTDATADFSAAGCGPELAIDGDPSTGWGFAGSAGTAAAVFQTAQPFTVPPDAELVVSIAQSSGKGMTPGRFRIFATTAPAPVRELDASIRAILALEPSEREPAQREAVAKYFRALSRSVTQAPRSPLLK